MLFSDLTKQVHLIKDLILSDMIYSDQDSTKAEMEFFKRLYTIKHWFINISWVNKKRCLLELLDSIRAISGLSLLLTCIWSCRSKDSVLSISESDAYTSFDVVPIDHNRTARPPSTLAEVMNDNLKWFNTLDPLNQATVIVELLMISGGPIMWTVLARAQTIYEKYRTEQLNFLECVVVNDNEMDKKQRSSSSSPEKNKKEVTSKNIAPLSADFSKTPGSNRHYLKELETHMSTWSATIKSIRDSLKLEEVELTYKDGTKKRIWKVNRPRPETTETVDFIQLLPSKIGKRILSYLPRTQLSDYARVNRYWAYLVDELRGELNARLKINADLEKLQDLVLRNEPSNSNLQTTREPRYISTNMWSTNLTPAIGNVNNETTKDNRKKDLLGFKSLQMKRPKIRKQIRKLSDLSTKLKLRGAAEENIWRWCKNVHKCVKALPELKPKGIPDWMSNADEMVVENVHFPCPLMDQTMDIKTPLKLPLIEDPSSTVPLRKNTKVSQYKKKYEIDTKQVEVKRPKYSLWSRSFTGLYRVVKIPSYVSFKD